MVSYSAKCRYLTKMVILCQPAPPEQIVGYKRKKTCQKMVLQMVMLTVSSRSKKPMVTN